MNMTLGSNKKVWTGLNKNESDDNCGKNLSCRRQGWQWADGATYDPNMNMWADNEPGTNDLCAELHKDGVKGKPCDDYKSYICGKR